MIKLHWKKLNWKLIYHNIMKNLYSLQISNYSDNIYSKNMNQIEKWLELDREASKIHFLVI